MLFLMIVCLRGTGVLSYIEPRHGILYAKTGKNFGKNFTFILPQTAAAMIFVYIILIVTGALPLLKTIAYIRLEERIRKSGISATGTVTRVQSVRRTKGPTTDRVFVRFGSIVPGQFHEANFVTRHRRYHSGDAIPVKYLPEKPDKIVVASRRGYWFMLVFSLLLLAFVVFAVYKIDEMV